MCAGGGLAAAALGAVSGTWDGCFGGVVEGSLIIIWATAFSTSFSNWSMSSSPGVEEASATEVVEPD